MTYLVGNCVISGSKRCVSEPQDVLEAIRGALSDKNNDKTWNDREYDADEVKRKKLP